MAVKTWRASKIGIVAGEIRMGCKIGRENIHECVHAGRNFTKSFKLGH